MARNTIPCKILVINGPNLGLLGLRQPEIYGSQTLDDILANLVKIAKKNDLTIEALQSNSESELIDFVNASYLAHTKKENFCRGIIINPAALTHTSIALRDALEMFSSSSIPVVEVHLSNIFTREDFRRHSYFSEISTAVISGLKAQGYLAALEFIVSLVKGANVGSLK